MKRTSQTIKPKGKSLSRNKSRSKSNRSVRKHRSLSLSKRKSRTKSYPRCGICFEPVRHSFGKTSCGHSFHPSELCAWLKSHHNCPVCRKKISVREVKQLCEAIFKRPHSHFLRTNPWFKLDLLKGPLGAPRKNIQIFIDNYLISNEKDQASYRRLFKANPAVTVLGLGSKPRQPAIVSTPVRAVR